MKLDFLLQTHDEETVSLEDLIKGQPSVLVFGRHLGCPHCRNYLAQLRKHSREIESGDFQIIVIVPHEGKFIQEFLDAFGPYPFPFYGDPKRKAYRELGHHSMPKIKMMAKAGTSLMTGKIKNVLPKKAEQKTVVKKSMNTQDVKIQGGTWLFDSDGEVVWKHIDRSPEDHASVEQILQHREKAHSE